MFDNFELLFQTFKSDLNLQNKNIKNKKNKKVHFFKFIRVYLIPVYYEIHNYENLWWNERELIDIKQNASQEFRDFKQKYPNISIENAQYLLYQLQ
jgi:hypothetical protein